MNRPHDLVIIVSLLALIFYLATGMGVAAARRKHGLAAPAMSGHDAVERALRVQGNTLEWLPLLLVPMWIFAIYFGDPIAAALGIVWIAGRILYWGGYARSADGRHLGFGVQGLAVLILIAGALFGAVKAYLLIGA